MPHWYAVVSNYTVTRYAPSSSQPWLHVVNPEVLVAMCCLPPPCSTEILCCGFSWTPSVPVDKAGTVWQCFLKCERDVNVLLELGRSHM